MTPSRDDELEKAAKEYATVKGTPLHKHDYVAFLAGARYQQGRDAKRPPSSHAAEATSYAIISELQSQLLQSQAQVEKMREALEKIITGRDFLSNEGIYNWGAPLREIRKIVEQALAKLDEGQK